VLAAVRDLEPYQRRRLGRSSITTIPGEIDPTRFQSALDELSRRAKRVYLHIDLDSIDADDARANRYAAPGGPSLDRVCDCVGQVCERLPVAAAAITAYDPEFDHDDRTLNAACRIARKIAHASHR
jgi:arginase